MAEHSRYLVIILEPASKLQSKHWSLLNNKNNVVLVYYILGQLKANFHGKLPLIKGYIFIFCGSIIPTSCEMWV